MLSSLFIAHSLSTLVQRAEFACAVRLGRLQQSPGAIGQVVGALCPCFQLSVGSRQCELHGAERELLWPLLPSCGLVVTLPAVGPCWCQLSSRLASAASVGRGFMPCVTCKIGWDCLQPVQFGWSGLLWALPVLGEGGRPAALGQGEAAPPQCPPEGICAPWVQGHGTGEVGDGRRGGGRAGFRTKPSPLKQGEDTHTLQTGSLVWSAAPPTGRDLALRRAGIVQLRHKQERYLRPCACEGSLPGGGLCWRKVLHDFPRQLSWPHYMGNTLLCWHNLSRLSRDQRNEEAQEWSQIIWSLCTCFEKTSSLLCDLEHFTVPRYLGNKAEERLALPWMWWPALRKELAEIDSPFGDGRRAQAPCGVPYSRGFTFFAQWTVRSMGPPRGARVIMM